MIIPQIPILFQVFWTRPPHRVITNGLLRRRHSVMPVTTSGRFESECALSFILPCEPRNRTRVDIVAACDVGERFAPVAAADRLGALVRGKLERSARPSRHWN
jgi:hypothetical protein